MVDVEIFRHVVNRTHNAPFVKTYATIKVSVLMHFVFSVEQQYIHEHTTFHLDLECQMKNDTLETSAAKCKVLALYTVVDHARRCFSSISPPESPGFVPPAEANPPVAAEPSGEIDAKLRWCHLSF